MQHITAIRKRICQGEAVFGTFLCELRATGVVTTMAQGGLDFFMIDMEHGMYDMTDVSRLIDAGKRTGICPIVRVPLNMPGWFAPVLDAGAEGILVPQIRTMDDVRLAVDQTKYHPLGRRGCHFCRPQVSFTRPVSKRQYMDQANAQIATMIQIETAEAAELVDEITATDGVDGLYLGPNDLAACLGHPDDVNHEDIAAIASNIGAACKKHGKIAAYHASPDQVPKLIEKGFSFFGQATAIQMFMQGIASVIEQVKPSRDNN